MDRAREGKVWLGYFHVWEQKPDGTSARRKKEKALGLASKPQHEALKELGGYIAQYTKSASWGYDLSGWRFESNIAPSVGGTGIEH